MALCDALAPAYELAETLERRASLAKNLSGTITLTFTPDALKSQAALIRIVTDTALRADSLCTKQARTIELLEAILAKRSLVDLIHMALALTWARWRKKILRKTPPKP